MMKYWIHIFQNYNDLYMNERCNHTNNEENSILDGNNIENFSTKTFYEDISIDDNGDVDNNWRRINDEDFCLILSTKFSLKMLVNYYIFLKNKLNTM